MTRILLVEDDHDVRLLVEHVLLDAGYEVDATDSVAGGLSLLECRSYDLVLADGRLGDGTGMQVADRARGLGDTPVLIVTGYAFDLPRNDLVRYDYLLKAGAPARAGRSRAAGAWRAMLCSTTSPPPIVLIAALSAVVRPLAGLPSVRKIVSKFASRRRRRACAHLVSG
jgi:CheY-like chemotaxis protein